MKEQVRVAITVAAVQIAYSLLFLIAYGEMLGEDQRIGRPQQLYIGAARRDYVPMVDRS